MKELGHFEIHENINGEDMASSMTIWDDGEIVVKRGKIAIYKESADNFLKDMNWLTTFLREDRHIKTKKNKRK